MSPFRHRVGRAALLVLGIVMAAGAAAQSSQAAKPAKTAPAAKAAAPFKPILEPRAIELLKTMSERLAAARGLAFTALVTYEHPSRLGPALAFTTLSEVLMQRPDKLRVVTPGDGPASEFTYDGKTMTAYAPAENMLALADAPATIDEALKEAFSRAAIYFPFADVLLADPYKNIADGLISAFYIGQSKVVSGIRTEMVAFANNEVFVQVWIGVDDKLPRRLRAVYRRDPLRLRHQLDMTQWQIDPVIPAGAFTAASPAGALAIPFDHPVKPAAGLQPPPAGKSR
ncbi:DUF2092 domain-containing protein [Accumulibacter sp.]|uniref:DUF2092 domain-containing protein n=1 Tax=Accumulibacter sp. TaxID=2053492 RepID=UPI00261526DD|nr:DUF2092 domain-containing protein [Accumulibacter sp.]